MSENVNAGKINIVVKFCLEPYLQRTQDASGRSQQMIRKTWSKNWKCGVLSVEPKYKEATTKVVKCFGDCLCLECSADLVRKILPGNL